MPTNRQIISDLRSINRMLSSDAMISDRVIYNEIKSCVLQLIKQQTDKRKLFQSPNIFTHLECIEMQQAPLGECCEYTSQYTIAKSKKRIPKIAEGIFGLLVQRCGSVDTLFSFKESTAKRFANLLTLHLPKNSSKYFWMYNNHLYVSTEDTVAVNLSAYFEEDVPNDLLCPQDCDCKSKPDCDPCLNPLDKEFKCPGYLENTMKDIVIRRLLSTYFNIKQDSTSDNKDDQSKP